VDNRILPMNPNPVQATLIDQVKMDVASLSKELNANTVDFLIVKPANVWMEDAKKRPRPKMLFSELWHEGELCILFADTNVGKSIKAVQIADSISRGVPIPGFKLEASRQPVVYFDFELSEKQFELRYTTEDGNQYLFDENFLRAEINPNLICPGDFEENIKKSIEKTIGDTGAKILIVDNITYLSVETERAKVALPLMKELKELKLKYELSVLCLAHTPKRDLSKPITRNDLQGSKMLINFCDSAFTIGECHRDKHIRYLKQIKARNTGHIYDSENVILCQLSKPSNFLGFNLIGFGNELDHLKPYSDGERESKKSEARALKKSGLTNVAIASRFGVTEAAVRKWLKDGKIEPVEPIEPGSNSTSSSTSP